MPDSDTRTRGPDEGFPGRGRAGAPGEGLPPSRTAILEQDPFRFAKRLPWEKITIWVIFLLLLYFLRSFFGIIFLTFILSYIASSLVNWICVRTGIGARPDHPARYPVTVAVFLAFLGLLAAAGWLVFPNLIEQGRLLVEQAQALIPRDKVLSPEERADAVVRDTLGAERFEALKGKPEYAGLREELARSLRRIPGQETALPPVAAPEGAGTNSTPAPKDLGQHLDGVLSAAMGKAVFAEFQKSRAYRETYGAVARTIQSATTDSLPAFADFLKDAFARVFAFGLQIVLSFVFSFMIVIGIPRFGSQVRSLETSRVANFYREIAPSVVSFGKSMGMAFQGQAVIAIMNTALTIVGLVVLGVPYPIALGVIVFACSFIPVLGVFISSAPILLVALQQGGVFLALEVVVLVALIHVIEAYFLNPRILGSVLHMNPLVVLVILIVGEHFFGVWGLLIGVPLCHYVFHQVLLKSPLPGRPKRSTGDLALATEGARETQTDATRQDEGGKAGSE